MKAETSDDVKNVEAWAEVIKEVLYLVPPHGCIACYYEGLFA